MKGNIFNIQRYCIHDGPGIRTTVFLKGCGMRCFWCHNPESWLREPQLQIFFEKCIGCGNCYKICPSGAHGAVDGNLKFDRELCVGCGKCADVCYTDALILRGKTMSVEEVMADVEKDRAYYEKSGGGVTFSGGEPLCQADFLGALLRESKTRGLHTAVDTAGNVPWEIFEQIMPFVDLWLYDLKILDNSKHKKATGVENNTILENLKMLTNAGKNVHIRIPVIPSVNDNETEMENIAEFLAKLRFTGSVELLPFHQMAGGKYESLGMPYRAEDMQNLPRENLLEFYRGFKKRNIAVAGGYE